MKINKVVATDVQSNETQTFTFGTATLGKNVVTANGSLLNNYIEFVFDDKSDCDKDVDVEFVINGDTFILSRHHEQDGSAKTVLKKSVDGLYQVVARTKAVSYVEKLINEQLSDMLKIDYVSNKSVEDFHGDLTSFEEIKMLYEVQQNAENSLSMANELKQNALRKVREYSSEQQVDVSGINDITEELDKASRELTVVTAQLGELKANQAVDSFRKDITNELETAQRKYNALLKKQDEIEQSRQNIKVRDDVELLIPKVRALRSVSEQRAEYENKRYALTTELEWHENELADVNQQLDDKQRQYAVSQDKRNRIESINDELGYVASLYERNKKLNETLLELNERQQRLSAEKVMYTNKLDTLEKSISEVKQSLDAFNIPAKSVGELLETVRVDVKIDEVTSQMEKLQSEISVKESQIAEKESTLVVQVKRFRSVAELDVAVTPMKAKDTILQVLESKYGKLEVINTSLKEKLNNMQRASEDYKFRIMQLEQSLSKTESERDKALLRKQEEFKREVFLNSQKVYNDDTSGVFAVSANFHDQEMDMFDQELSARRMDRDLLYERAYELDGAIKEIKRHIEINSAEMETLLGEKNNIVSRYNDILAQNSNESVFNYLKALNSDNGTQYLLDVQQEAVRSETELAELKRYTEGLRSKMSSLKSRLKHLKKTQQQLDDTQASIDSLISTNDKLKDELADISERLSAGYEQYKAISRQLEGVDSKLEDIRGAIVEITKTIKVNEAQIVESTNKAKAYAGSDDLEQAISNFKYEIGDIESERQMLVESKQSIEKDVFKKRLELEKTQWLYESKSQEYEELNQELKIEFELKGLDFDTIGTLDIDTSLEPLRKIIAEYDTMRQSLSEKIENLYGILQSQPAVKVDVNEIDAKQQQIDLLNNRIAELEEQRKVCVESYVDSNNKRIKVTAAAVQAQTLSSLKSTIEHSNIIGLLISDKIKSTLNIATQYLNAFTDGNYVITAQDYKVVVNGVNYDDLPNDIKTAVYVSIILSVPNTDTSEGKWLIFEEDIGIDKQVLSDMLLQIDNVSYVINYDLQQGE